MTKMRRVGKAAGRERVWAACPPLLNPHIHPRHPEEPRSCAASRRMAAGTCGHPSRLAVKNGEHLRMTAVYGWWARRKGAFAHPTAVARALTYRPQDPALAVT